MSKKQENKIPKPTSSKLELANESNPSFEEQLNLTNSILKKRNELTFNSLPISGSEEKDCGCSGEDGNPAGKKTDLIVLIDTSGSMVSSARAISNAVMAALEEAKRTCEPDLKLTFLGVDGVHNGTLFTQSHRDFIFDLNGTVPLAGDEDPVGLQSEQGANAIEDLSKYTKWREDACRTIFYISDEELDSIYPLDDFANETAATNAAITEANANNVTVFAHHLTYQNRAPEIIQNYIDLCYNTGGDVYFSDAPDQEEYVILLTDVICNSCGKSRCEELEFPEIEPCISIKWGDSECDCIESSDFEVMTITVCNCYTNVTFGNFTIPMIEVLDEEGNPVPTLPNGTPSVKIHPIGVYCFGDIEPCACVSREFVIINEGAKAGKYKIVLKGVYFEVVKPFLNEETSFEFEICKD